MKLLRNLSKLPYRMTAMDDLFRLDKYVGSKTLAERCFQAICKDLDIISHKENSLRYLLNGLILPSEICDKLIEYVLQNDTIEFHDEFFHIFSDTSTTTLKRVKIVSSNLTNQSAQILASHKLVELEFIDCPNVTEAAIEYINANAGNLQSLACRGKHSSIITTAFTEYQQRGYVFKTLSLRSLALEYVGINPLEYNILLTGLPNLTHLDLSNNLHVGYFTSFDLVPNLISLVLHNVKINQTQAFVSNICHLKDLRYLDISQLDPANGRFENPNTILSDIVNGLPQLTSLDISGTNLPKVQIVDCGIQTTDQSSYFEFDDNSNSKLCDIPGLISRVDRPLQFLGLYKTDDGACRRRNIPAKLIAGDANEDQILVAAHAYMNNKPGLLLKVLNNLYRVYRYENCHRVDQALCVILKAMENHPLEKRIQIYASVTLFYVIKMKKEDKLEPQLIKRIVSILLTRMIMYKNEGSIMHSGYRTLLLFRIPQDIMSNYEALVKLVLHSVKHTQRELEVQRIGIFMLSSLAIAVTGREKRLLGYFGCIKTMLELIKYKVDHNICDSVLEMAWSTMWNMTDETPVNCERFLGENGMVLLYRCAEQYRQKQELMKYMMGLLSNVAEIQHLRVHLVKKHYMILFGSLLRSTSEDIEIPYHVAGILAHIASDGVEAWTITEPTRTGMLKLMAEAIEHWNILSERSINYRSFLPLLRLLDVYHTPECQHWAVWALANFTTVDPDKYSILVIREGGLEKLSTLIDDSRTYEEIRELAHRVIMNCRDRVINNELIIVDVYVSQEQAYR